MRRNARRWWALDPGGWGSRVGVSRGVGVDCGWPAPGIPLTHPIPHIPNPVNEQLVNASYADQITPRRGITDAPFWVPSQSLQLKMVTRAHSLLEVLNQVRLAVGGGG